MRSDSNVSFDASDELLDKGRLKNQIKMAVSQQKAHITLFLTGQGTLFAAGNRNSHLIPESIHVSDTKPVPIQMPVSGIAIEGVAVGPDHALAWDSNGNTFGWGFNKYGCIGVCENNLRSFEVVKSPEIVHSFKCGKVVACYIVENASFAVTYQGKIFYWGK